MASCSSDHTPTATLDLSTSTLLVFGLLQHENKVGHTHSPSLFTLSPLTPSLLTHTHAHCTHTTDVCCALCTEKNRVLPHTH